jgi:hypothetical protein
MKKNQLVLLFACFVSLVVKAQIPKMETDRPGQSVTPHITLKNALQFETGLSGQYGKIDGQEHDEFLYPTALVKYGLAKKAELFMLIKMEGDYDFTPAKHKTGGGLQPLQLGIKYNLVDEKGALPKTAVIATAALPKIASPDFKSDFVATTFILAMENSFSKKFSLTYNAGIQWEPADVHALYLYTLTPQFEISDRLTVFGELYGFISTIESADHRLNAGLSYRIVPNLQVDFSGGIGITKTSPDSFVEAGFSFRIPH